MRADTRLPPYLPYPRFLLQADLTQTAKLLYALLLDRATLSQTNGWLDEGGRIYLVFPIEKIAAALDRSTMTVKTALSELEDAGLIKRRRSGFSKPNRIYVKMPPDGQKTFQVTDRKPSSKLKQVERGELDADAFLGGITAMLTELTRSYRVVPGAEVLFPSGREVIGRCPRCGSDVTESKKGFFCERSDCKFGLWRDNKFLTAKRITLDKKMVAALLERGRVRVDDIYSEKTGKRFSTDLLLEDDGIRSSYRFDFGKEGTK